MTEMNTGALPSPTVAYAPNAIGSECVSPNVSWPERRHRNAGSDRRPGTEPVQQHAGRYLHTAIGNDLQHHKRRQHARTCSEAIRSV
jgi:hypothetical protein